jgi:hypothetical protein
MWTTDFDPPDRCPLPSPDANTVWLGIYEGAGSVIADLSGNGNDGAKTADVDWGTCCQVGRGNYTPCSPEYMTFNALTSLVNCGSDVSIDDLPSADFTIEAWIAPDSAGEGTFGTTFRKGSWYIRMIGANDIQAWATFDVTSANSRVVFPYDDDWHHIAAVWDSGTNTFSFYIDGIEPSYVTQIAGANNYVSDAADSGIIGNNSVAGWTFDGGIQWIRISDNERYTATFTPPARCTIPDDDANTVSVWVLTDPDLLVSDLYGPNDGTPTDLDSGCDCVTTGRDETCDEEVYVANKQNLANLTHVFIDDGGVFSVNLLTQSLPYRLLPAIPVADDRIYFGSDTTLVDSGPFCSLVFDLAQAQVAIADIVWEYYNGAWVALTVQDNTDTDGAMTGAAFDTTGVKSIHWEQPDDWVAVAINGITAYWVRAEVQDAGTSPPIQQNTHIYTVTWPYAEIQADKVGGDVANLIRMYIKNQSDDNLDIGTPNPQLFSDRVIIGLRSLSRGADFTAYINLSDEQNPSTASVTAPGGDVSFQTRTDMPTGRYLQCLNLETTEEILCQIRLSPAAEWTGKYHIFIRGTQKSGVAGDLQLQLRGDFGRLEIPFFARAIPSELGIIDFVLYGKGTGTEDCDLFDFIIMPIDEWALDTKDTNLSSPPDVALGSRGEFPTYLDVDSIGLPKTSIRSNLFDVTTGFIAAGYQVVSSAPAIAQSRRQQRYWFLHIDESTDPAIGSQPEVVNTVQMFNVQRYFNMRGSE